MSESESGDLKNSYRIALEKKKNALGKTSQVIQHNENRKVIVSPGQKAKMFRRKSG